MSKNELDNSKIHSGAYKRGQEDAARRRYTPTSENEDTRDEYIKGFTDEIKRERGYGSENRDRAG